MAADHHLAPYACHAGASRGRLFKEPESATRGCFQRDRDRIIHSAAFRKLEYKTQVFVNHEGDYFRTRLTHSLEVAQIARSACRYLCLNEDLAEALALAHDLGHPPFGHAGEEALNEMMEPFGGFDHNAQSLRVVTRLERRYADFDGLNLTWETLEGVIKHNGSLSRPLPRAIAEYGELHDLETHTYAGAEAQVAALSDDIAYNNHDIDDGLRAGLFTTGDLAEVPLVGPIFAEVRSDHPGLDESRLIFEAVRRMIGAMVTDALEETGRRIAEAKPETAADIRALDGPVAGFSAPMRENDRALKAFLFDNMYRHYRLNRMSSKARRVVKELFGLLLSEPECLPSEWRDEAGDAGSEATAQLVADYIAGMTDRFALDEHRQLFDLRARMS
ncbi:MAG: deoxyguanosinetriphosphate triphosphohydrolase [Rhodospirillales bacterium]|jgi:dGTPase|nr:deoxyguanosinetriphosphate triphosphohydrolase [Rhodospirillales bacterium]HIJ43040.1 deoxyguanosinetriphosphate triphosphohydrolase [Rhodospirillaceae bacterium]MDP7099482.1 deoxyguanosinetriphosphate triphosphohydrolase [Rhodospirillales bacterium]MDP7216245.1 deoxyguanosinetriphosphate triphosphohydrolase [Rhodospirillales bacterium]HIJ44896.1 deoxyguanosinetriphosphate triphosphohydrolase [Rhodospirillaceae bacterium]